MCNQQRQHASIRWMRKLMNAAYADHAVQHLNMRNKSKWNAFPGQLHHQVMRTLCGSPAQVSKLQAK